MPFDDRVARLIPELRAWQEHLHRNPELSFEEFETTDYLARILSAMPGVSLARPTKTGLVASIQGEKDGPGTVLGVRGDIDALPITEESGLPYASARPGVMHACGHDGHTAMLLGLAKLLSENRAAFSGEARLFFQHARRRCGNGARGRSGGRGCHAWAAPFHQLAHRRFRRARRRSDRSRGPL